MKHTRFHSKRLGRRALLCVMASLCAWPSFAQQDLQVMVSGPWSYATDTTYPNRLFLVAPGKSDHHKVYLLPGADPTVFKSGTPSPTGTYTLDYTAVKGTPATAYPNPPVLSGVSIGSPAKKVRPILVNKKNKNYVISLPTPDGYSTYSGSMGTSESEVSNKRISNATVEPKQYTTWMVLHYNVAQIPNSFRVSNGASLPTTGGGISIVLGDPKDYDDDAICDHVSLESVKERNRLWHVKQYARFPKLLDPQGTQNHGMYDYDRCSDSNPKKYPLDLGAAGSADCHASQGNVNNAISGATVPTTVP